MHMLLTITNSSNKKYDSFSPIADRFPEEVKGLVPRKINRTEFNKISNSLIGLQSLLNKENDAIWEIQKPAVLIENDLWDYVENTCLVGDGANKWREMGEEACADLMLTITSSELGIIAEYETAEAM